MSDATMTTETPTSTSTSTNDAQQHQQQQKKTITEGSTMMNVPADQETSVFYNPVQVQNRDLSILMITLFAERRAVRQALKVKRKELNNNSGNNNNNGNGKGNTPLKQEEIQAKLKEYETTLDAKELILRQQQQQQLEVEVKPEQPKQETAGTGKEDYTPLPPQGITILDALAASGLRSIRYWKEIPGVQHVTINDLEDAAIQRAKDNLKQNDLLNVLLQDNQDRARGICVHHGDATHEMYMSRRPQQQRQNPQSPINTQQQPMWDVIDLDPYGSAAPFLDGAVQAVENGGMLCITCTDMAALGGSHPETAYGRYASLPIQSSQYLQELALRILLHSISVSAARYGRTIRPILSVGMAFYIRVFVEITNDKRGVIDLSLNIGHVYQSTKCSTFVTLPHGQMGGKKGNVYQSRRLTPATCPETDAPFKVGGPLWLGPLHDQDVVKTALERVSDKSAKKVDAQGKNITSPNMEWIATRKRLEGLLTSVSEELDTPLYYQLPDLCRTMRCSSPPLRQFMAGIFNAGYDVSGYHKAPHAIKTNAPSHIVWDVLRAWLVKNPPKKEPEKDSPAAKILAVKPSIEVDFTIPKSFRQKNNKVSRFPLNPEKNWGPKPKASGNSKRKADGDDNENKGEEEPPTKRTATEDAKGE